MRTFLLHVAIGAVLLSSPLFCAAQAMPATGGETLSGRHVVPAEIVKGHAAVLIAGFSHDGGMQSGAWRKAVRADASLNGIPVYELAMLEKAPGMIRGIIKSGMRKDVPPPQQDQVFVITEDQRLWEKYFGVENEKDPYVVMLDAKGNVLWHGHGAAAILEPELKAALK